MKNKKQCSKFFCATFLVLFTGFTSIAQNYHKIDSLKAVSLKVKDTTLVNTLVLLSDMYLHIAPDSANFYAEEALKLAKKIGFKKGICNSYDNIGIINAIGANYPVAREYFLKSLEIKKELKDIKGVSGLYFNISGLYRQEGKYPEALDYQLRSLKTFEELKDMKGIGRNYSNIGLIYGRMGNDSMALEYYFKALKLNKELDVMDAVAANFANIGNIYSAQKKYLPALDYLNKSVKIDEDLGDLHGMASGYTSLGNVYKAMGDRKRAKEYYENALKINQEQDDKIGIISNSLGMGSISLDNADYTAAVTYFQQAFDLAKLSGLRVELSEASRNLAQAYEKKNDYKNAYHYHTLYSQIKDSMLNQESTKQIAEMATKYESDKKEMQITSLNKDNEILTKDQKLKETQLNKQMIINYAVVAGLILVLAFAFFVARSYRQKQAANLLLEEKNAMIEEKNKDITDSINYAKRIQFTLLAQNEILTENLKEHFVLFQPKDIVSGDFYWAIKKEDRFYLAVCDSTGHGVPGAFMSLLNISFLNEAITEKNMAQPNEILDHVRKRLIENVSQDGAQDGMDGILLCFEHGKITYSAAHNSPVLVRNNTLTLLPGDKMPVGKGEKSHPFTLHTIDKQKGDALYFYTDGYPDQFGGPAGKKFKYKKLDELLVSVSAKSVQEQQSILTSTLNSWKGNLEQVDDILLIGMKL
ncbi:MAG TPA: tetratricopeptide repeat protein [Bacteroidia bacterium]|jgi:serine phosphatase RsbU (regulator of sigma subunit)